MLFKDIDPIIQDCINESVDLKNERTKTSVTLKHLESIKKTNVNRASFITLEENNENPNPDLNEPENPPEFAYMPNKIQIMTMIANAAYQHE